jgi:hypothetical protein
MAINEAIAYTRVPAGTFRKWVAAGRIPAHGGRRVQELEPDAAGDVRTPPVKRETFTRRVAE